MKTILFIAISMLSNTSYKGNIINSFTLDSLGACQGITKIDDKFYAYGDSNFGTVRAYSFKNDSLVYSNSQYYLTESGKNVIKHPTGIAYRNGVAFVGNSTRSKENPDKWIAEIYMIDWRQMLLNKTLDNCILKRIEDDLAIQGTRPEYISYQAKEYIATADYGAKNNEVRLYDPNRLAQSDKTSDSNVLVAKFKCGPWVQNLHWIEEQKILVLVQNQEEGLGWRLTFVNLESSIQTGKAVVLKIIDSDRKDELEGFCLVNNNFSKAIAVTASKQNNAHIIDLE